MGELGRLIEAWADRQRFRPTQKEIARELKVSPQQMSNWMRGGYKGMLKPLDLERIARMMTAPGASQSEVFEEVLEAVLHDTGALPKGKRLRIM
jgi:transcriptional regulator with XRE-family HTH domain